MKQEEQTLVTKEKYLLLEDQATYRSEYERGRVQAMGGGTINHGIIGNNINTALSNSVRQKELNCVVINGDVRIFIDEADSFVYPDGMVICDGIQRSEHDPHSIVNPLLIVEVLSKTTESYDRGDKFHKYCSLPSFKEYVLIDQNKPVVDVLYRETKTYWKMTTTIGLDKSIYLNTLDVEIPLREIYGGAQNLQPPAFQLDL